jgi:hypothetical protein
MKIALDTSSMIDTNINRVELISEEGRVFVLSMDTIKNVRLALQDEGKTLKIFYENNTTNQSINNIPK